MALRLRRVRLANRGGYRVALVSWLVVGVGVLITSYFMPDRDVTNVYRLAAERWLAGKDIYTGGINDYLYLPHAAVFWTPLALLPELLAGLLWRALCITIFGFGVWRMARLAREGGAREYFPIVTLLALPVALSSARNGQMNLPLTAMMIFAAEDLTRRRWWWATFWLCLGLACKPLMIVMLLLAGAAYPPLRGRLALGLVALGLFPFLAQHPGYVARQYPLLVEKLLTSADPAAVGMVYNDLFGILVALHVYVPVPTQTVIRGVAALVTLGLALLAVRRWDATRGSVALLTLAGCYLMLFNPRTERLTYMVIAPMVAVFAAWAFWRDRHRVLGWLLVAMEFGMAFRHQLTGRRNSWFLPSLCLAFTFYVAWIIAANRAPGLGDEEPLPPGPTA